MKTRTCEYNVWECSLVRSKLPHQHCHFGKIALDDGPFNTAQIHGQKRCLHSCSFGVHVHVQKVCGRRVSGCMLSDSLGRLKKKRNREETEKKQKRNRKEMLRSAVQVCTCELLCTFERVTPRTCLKSRTVLKKRCELEIDGRLQLAT